MGLGKMAQEEKLEKLKCSCLLRDPEVRLEYSLSTLKTLKKKLICYLFYKSVLGPKSQQESSRLEARKISPEKNDSNELEQIAW